MRVQPDLPNTGFVRAVAGRSTLMMDCGYPSPTGGLAHAGLLSFELSFSKQRLIVNCGTYVGDNMDWLKAARATAAHTALIQALGREDLPLDDAVQGELFERSGRVQALVRSDAAALARDLERALVAHAADLDSDEQDDRRHRALG